MSETVERTGVVDPWPALALAGLLDVEAPDLEKGEELPLLWHWLYLLERPVTGDLGADGHPVRGVLPTPPAARQRRVFAGGRVRRLGPLRCGVAATRRTTIAGTTRKHGRSGPLTIVSLTHEISQDGAPVVAERQDIVYLDRPVGARPDAEAPPRPAAGPEVSDRAWVVDTDPVMLFRFSALTYNAHRIHYDHAYAVDVEGYPGLVVHGPLQAILMSEAARRQGPQPLRAEFTFRLLAPAVSGSGLIVEAGAAPQGGRRPAWETMVRTGDGTKTAEGTLSPL